MIFKCFYVYGWFGLHLYLCTMFITGALRGQGDPLGAELQTIVSYHVGSGNPT